MSLNKNNKWNIKVFFSGTVKVLTVCGFDNDEIFTWAKSWESKSKVKKDWKVSDRALKVEKVFLELWIFQKVCLWLKNYTKSC